MSQEVTISSVTAKTAVTVDASGYVGSSTLC